MIENLSESSNDSNATSSLETNWSVVINDATAEKLNDYICNSIPKSSAYQTNHELYCRFCLDLSRHKMKKQLRQCNQPQCPVKFNVLLCEKKDIGSIAQKLEHNHCLSDYYNNYNGLPEKVKTVIKNLINTNPKLIPRQIRTYLNNN